MEDQRTINGGYDLEGVIWHQHSNKLMVKILELWNNKHVPIIDLGCGHNFYVSVLRYAGYIALGYDAVDLGSLWCMEVDVTRPMKNIHWYQEEGEITNVLSLEVGEHIPSDKSQGYLDNLASFGGDIIMSWAIPGQAGHGHINCQSNDWVIAQMKQRGYYLDGDKTASLRESVRDCHCSWFRNTLMYFKK